MARKARRLGLGLGFKRADRKQISGYVGLPLNCSFIAPTAMKKTVFDIISLPPTKMLATSLLLTAQGDEKTGIWALCPGGGACHIYPIGPLSI